MELGLEIEEGDEEADKGSNPPPRLFLVSTVSRALNPPFCLSSAAEAVGESDTGASNCVGDLRPLALGEDDPRLSSLLSMAEEGAAMLRFLFLRRSLRLFFSPELGLRRGLFERFCASATANTDGVLEVGDPFLEGGDDCCGGEGEALGRRLRSLPSFLFDLGLVPGVVAISLLATVSSVLVVLCTGLGIDWRGRRRIPSSKGLLVSAVLIDSGKSNTFTNDDLSKTLEDLNPDSFSNTRAVCFKSNVFSNSTTKLSAREPEVFVEDINSGRGALI